MYLLRNDPLTRGPRLFNQHCASCHSYSTRPIRTASMGRILIMQRRRPSRSDGRREDRRGRDAKGKSSTTRARGGGAPNLFGFASRDWIRGLLDPEKIAAPVVIGKPSRQPTRNRQTDLENHNRPLLSDYFGNTNHKAGRMVDVGQAARRTMLKKARR